MPQGLRFSYGILGIALVTIPSAPNTFELGRQSLIHSSYIVGKSGHIRGATVDTVANILVQPGQRPVRLSHGMALRLFATFSAINRMSVWLDSNANNPALRAAKAHLQEAGTPTIRH